MACRSRLKKLVEIDSCTIEYLARFSLTMPSLAAKNARTVELNRPAPGRPGLLRGGSARFKTPSARTASRRRDRPRQALAKPRAAHGDDPRRSSADRGRLAVVTSRTKYERIRLLPYR